MKINHNEDTIAAVSTPAGEGGIGIVRLSGGDAVRIADRMFTSADGSKPSKFKSHTIHYGHIFEKSKIKNQKSKIKKEIIDEVLLTIMRAPKTYTKEDMVEINCHGGITALRKVTELAVKEGARTAEPGEFTKRAFLKGRLDLTQAEAVLDIVRAKTDAGLRVSVDQLEGELSREINSLRNSIIDISADIEAAIDFPEEDIELDTARSWLKKIKAARRSLERLADTYHHGAILKEGITAVICGRANVGKSSLMNLLLKRDRVIVTHIPGTTRDAIEEMVNIKGVPIRLVDTAGLKKRSGIVERAGIDKSRSYLSKADLILCVLDGSQRLKKDDVKLLKSLHGRCAVIVVNKCDRKLILEARQIRKFSKDCDVIKISCLEKEGIDRLEDKVYNKIWSGKVLTSHQLMLNNARHKDAIDRAIASLSSAEGVLRRKLSPEFLSVDVRESINALGEIVGETYTDDILDVIFSKFCIGK
jgi:tRNA modification GTPase